MGGPDPPTGPLAQSQLPARRFGDDAHHLAEVESALAGDPATVLVLGRDIQGPAAQLLDLDAGGAEGRLDLDDPPPGDHAPDRRDADAEGGAAPQQVIGEAGDLVGT